MLVVTSTSEEWRLVQVLAASGGDNWVTQAHPGGEARLQQWEGGWPHLAGGGGEGVDCSPSKGESGDSKGLAVSPNNLVPSPLFKLKVRGSQDCWQWGHSQNSHRWLLSRSSWQGTVSCVLRSGFMGKGRWWKRRGGSRQCLPISTPLTARPPLITCLCRTLQERSSSSGHFRQRDHSNPLHKSQKLCTNIPPWLPDF